DISIRLCDRYSYLGLAMKTYLPRVLFQEMRAAEGFKLGREGQLGEYCFMDDDDSRFLAKDIMEELGIDPLMFEPDFFPSLPGFLPALRWGEERKPIEDIEYILEAVEGQIRVGKL